MRNTAPQRAETGWRIWRGNESGEMSRREIMRMIENIKLQVESLIKGGREQHDIIKKKEGLHTAKRGAEADLNYLREARDEFTENILGYRESLTAIREAWEEDDEITSSVDEILEKIKNFYRELFSNNN